jgi:hypothetical protein
MQDMLIWPSVQELSHAAGDCHRPFALSVFFENFKHPNRDFFDGKFHISDFIES